jgi:hypothetical protein
MYMVENAETSEAGQNSFGECLAWKLCGWLETESSMEGESRCGMDE